MRRRLSSGLLALVVLPMSSGPALAVGVLDQEALPGGIGAHVTSFGDLWQTFTSGLTGQLDTVALHGAVSFGNTWNIAIRAVAAGAPTGPNLATGTAPAPPSAGGTDIALTPVLPVTAGSQYAIVALGTTPGWYFAGADYLGGTGQLASTQRFAGQPR
jgi:hypothetical protein